PGHMAAKIRWLRRRVPKAVRFHQPVSYLVERLTGQAVMDPSHASTTMLLELATGRWAATLLEAFEIDVTELPAIVPATQIAGELAQRGAALLGLPVGTPIAVGTGDDFSTALGGGLVSPDGRTAVCAIGTAEVVGALAATPILD